MTSAYERGNIPEIQLHHRLRIAREYAQLEQSELADRMGISRTSVSAAESGRKSPRRITLNAWALACGVPASWLLTGQEPVTPPPVTPEPPTGDQSVVLFPVKVTALHPFSHRSAA